jgi:hypothetical protein
MQNKRDSVRKAVSVPATIDSGGLKVHGTILDVSSTGARVRLASNAFLSTQCTLTTALFGAAIPSRIVWRRGPDIGLRFKTTLNLRQEVGWVRANHAGPAPGGFGRRAPA